MKTDKELILYALNRIIKDNYRRTLSKLELMIENEENLFKIQEFLTSEINTLKELTDRVISLEDEVTYE